MPCTCISLTRLLYSDSFKSIPRLKAQQTPRSVMTGVNISEQLTCVNICEAYMHICIYVCTTMRAVDLRPLPPAFSQQVGRVWFRRGGEAGQGRVPEEAEMVLVCSRKLLLQH